MRGKALRLALWTLGAALGTVHCLAVDAVTQQPAPTGISVIPEVANAWPWLALGAVLLLVAVIAFATRRRRPFGNGRNP